MMTGGCLVSEVTWGDTEYWIKYQDASWLANTRTPLYQATPTHHARQRELNNKSLRGAAGLTNTNQEFCLKYCQCLIISAQQLYKSLHRAKHSEYSRQFLWEILATIQFVCSRNVKRATGTGALQGNNSQSYHQAQPDHYYSLQSAASFYDFHKHGKHPSLSLSHCLGHWFSSLHWWHNRHQHRTWHLLGIWHSSHKSRQSHGNGFSGLD